MNRTRAQALRTEARPHPGRKHGGQTRAVSTGKREGWSSNKFLGRLQGLVDDFVNRKQP